jgi:hypothetical protein
MALRTDGIVLSSETRHLRRSRTRLDIATKALRSTLSSHKL